MTIKSAAARDDSLAPCGVPAPMKRVAAIALVLEAHTTSPISSPARNAALPIARPTLPAPMIEILNLQSPVSEKHGQDGGYNTKQLAIRKALNPCRFNKR